jgi:hypothetical protein
MAQYSAVLEQVQLWWSEQQPDLRYASEDLSYLFLPNMARHDWRKGRSVQQLAAELRPYLKVDAVRASRMLEQPAAQVALQVASQLVPQPFGSEIQVVVDVIEMAGSSNVADRQRALRGLVVAGAGLLLVMFLRGQAS